MEKCVDCSGFQARVKTVEDCVVKHDAQIDNLWSAQKTHTPWGVFKWLFGLLVACMIGLFAFQGAILSQLSELRMSQAVMSTKLDTLQRQVNGGYVGK